MNNYKHGKVSFLSHSIGENGIPITAWSVISTKKQPTAIIAAKETSVYLISASQWQEVFPSFSSVAGTKSSITSISVSLDGCNVALLTESGMLWLGSADFSIKYCEFVSGLVAKPKQIVW